MIEQIVGWIAGIMLVLYIPYLIYYNVIQAASRWRCRKKQYLKPINTCYENGCKFSKYCEHYEHVYTAEEIENLKKLICEKKN